MKCRLDKFLSNNGFGSRTDVKKLIKSGAVSVSGVAAKSADSQIDLQADIISVFGKTVHWQEHYYYMLNKPAGVITASRDKKVSTVLDLLDDEDRRRDIQPVGRLDKDTVGLLLLTDDGDLNHRLMSPKHHVDKTYIAEVTRELTEAELSQMRLGIDIGDDDLTLPCEVQKLPVDLTYSLTIHEGRFHQVKRMFEHFNSEVTYLKRISIGHLQLDEDLEEGEYRELTSEELAPWGLDN